MIYPNVKRLPMLTGEALRAQVIGAIASQRTLPRDTAFTCETCEDNAWCPSRFDAYNTHGDCLEDK